MCGIIGYIGDRPAAGLLLEGLKKLEYRGYDSAGIAVYSGGKISLRRAKGKLAALDLRLKEFPIDGTPGIGHTRWATHGKPSEENAHPHRSEHVVVVHNGIIENHKDLQKKLSDGGYRFTSETDTEIVPFLIESYLEKGLKLEDAVRKTIREIDGAFAFAILSDVEPDKIIAVKNSSPLILGVGTGENFIASDIPALLPHTRDVIALDDGEMAIITKNEYRITNFDGEVLKRKPRVITWSQGVAEKGGLKHFMLKEIHEQPRAVADTLRGRINESGEGIVLDSLGISDEQARSFRRILAVACGTSWHAALVGKFWLEGIAKIPTEIDLASEYRYRNPLGGDNVLCIPVSQSGETADTLAALEEAKRLGAHVLSICNVVDSSIARKSHGVIYTNAGPEIGVASTKAFTTQLASLALLSLDLAFKRGFIDAKVLAERLSALSSLPAAIEICLKMSDEVREVAKMLAHATNFLYLGRGPSFPIALEGALKMKEISYAHAEGYAGGEIKHGPIALVDEKMPVVALMSGGPMLTKMISNVEEVSARGAQVIAVTMQGENNLDEKRVVRLTIPRVHDFIRPIVESIPLQLLAYHVADIRGLDVDQPRNLAKSVTVE